MTHSNNESLSHLSFMFASPCFDGWFVMPEFDNPYFGYSQDPALYRLAYRALVDRCEALYGKSTCRHKIAFCWHSWAAPRWIDKLMDFYPGDSYVDWVGVSIFQQVYPWAVGAGATGGEFAGGNMAHVREVLDLAHSLHKPIMIAESTPFGGIYLHDQDPALLARYNLTTTATTTTPTTPRRMRKTKSNTTYITNTTHSTTTTLVDNSTTPNVLDIWKLWFQPTLDLIEEYDIGMWSFIDCDWNVQPMWKGVGFGDTRLVVSGQVMDQWWDHVLSNRRFTNVLECSSNEEEEDQRSTSASTSTSTSTNTGHSSFKNETPKQHRESYHEYDYKYDSNNHGRPVEKVDEYHYDSTKNGGKPVHYQYDSRYDDKASQKDSKSDDRPSHQVGIPDHDSKENHDGKPSHDRQDSRHHEPSHKDSKNHHDGPKHKVDEHHHDTRKHHGTHVRDHHGSRHDEPSRKDSKNHHHDRPKVDEHHHHTKDHHDKPIPDHYGSRHEGKDSKNHHDRSVQKWDEYFYDSKKNHGKPVHFHSDSRHDEALHKNSKNHHGESVHYHYGSRFDSLLDSLLPSWLLTSSMTSQESKDSAGEADATAQDHNGYEYDYQYEHHGRPIPTQTEYEYSYDSKKHHGKPFHYHVHRYGSTFDQQESLSSPDDDDFTLDPPMMISAMVLLLVGATLVALLVARRRSPQRRIEQLSTLSDESSPMLTKMTNASSNMKVGDEDPDAAGENPIGSAVSKYGAL
jgi:hypothetical protein